MGSAANIVNVPQILKDLWEDDIHDFFYSEAPLLAHMSKRTDWDGLLLKVTVQYGGMAGRSHDFTSAQTNKSPPKYKQMDVEVRDNFAIWSVDHKLITLSRNQRGALVRALAENTEKAMSKLKRSSCWGLWRNGGGAVGKISAISTDTITLADVNDVRNFDLDDVIQLSADDGTGGGGVRTGSLTIVGINEDAGTLKCNVNVTAGIPGAVVGDFIFHSGDYNKAFAGIPAYVTINNPGTSGNGTSTPASIWNMNRADFPTRLSGHRFTGTVATVVDDIQKALAKAFRRNCDISHLFVTPEIHQLIESSLGNNRRYVDDNVGKIGFQALEFTALGGKRVRCYADADIPKSPDGTKTLVYGLNMSTWRFHTADEYPMWLTSVANGSTKFMLEANANQSEGRLGGYGNCYTKAPGENFVLILT
jgi:hypothetical protein